MKPIHENKRIRRSTGATGFLKTATFLGTVDNTDIYYCTYNHGDNDAAYLGYNGAYESPEAIATWGTHYIIASPGWSYIAWDNEYKKFLTPSIEEFIKAHHNLHS